MKKINVVVLTLSLASTFLITLPTVAAQGKEFNQSQQAEEFKYFIRKFFTDTEFQATRVKFPLEKVSIDESGETVSTILKEVYIPFSTPPHFKHEYEILIYDNDMEPIDSHSTEKTVHFSGVDNGINMKLKFTLISNEWILVRYINANN